MATPEIKSTQVNKAELEKLKKAAASMPKTKSTSSDKLALGLSGDKNRTFGNLSNTKSTLASSLETKTGKVREKSSDTPAVSEIPSEDITISFSEQSTLKSNINTLQRDITKTGSASVFSLTGTPETANSDIRSTTTTTTTIDTSSLSAAKTYMQAAADYASQAETAAKNQNWTQVVSLYNKAQEELNKAAKEINNASAQGLDTTDISNELAGLSTKYSQNSASAQKFATMANLRAGVDASSISGSTTAQSAGFWSQCMNGFGQGMTGGFTNFFTGLLGGGEKKSDGAGSKGGASGSGSSSGGKVSDEEFDTSKASKAAKEEIRSRGVENRFKTAQSKVNTLSSQKDAATSKRDDVNSRLEGVKANYQKENEKIAQAVQKYDTAKSKAETNKQEITKQDAIVKEQSAIVDGLKEQITSKKAYRDETLLPAQNKALGNYNSAKIAKGDADRELARAKASGDKAAIAAAESKQLKAIQELEIAQREYEAAVQKVQNANKEIDKLEKTDLPPAQEKLKQATNKKGELERLQERYDSDVKEQGEILENAEGKCESYKKQLDELYEQQTEHQATIDKLAAQIDAEEQTKKLTREEKNAIIEKYNDENGWKVIKPWTWGNSDREKK